MEFLWVEVGHLCFFLLGFLAPGFPASKLHLFRCAAFSCTTIVRMDVWWGLHRFWMSEFMSGEVRIDFKSIKWGGVRIFKSKREDFLCAIIYWGRGSSSSIAKKIVSASSLAEAKRQSIMNTFHLKKVNQKREQSIHHTIHVSRCTTGRCAGNFPRKSVPLPPSVLFPTFLLSHWYTDIIYIYIYSNHLTPPKKFQTGLICRHLRTTCFNVPSFSIPLYWKRLERSES